MTYSIENPRDPRLESTPVSNIFLLDVLPDVPGEYAKVYCYAFASARLGIHLTHTALAEKLGMAADQVLAAWRYFAERKIVRKIPKVEGDETQFDVEFLDLRGITYSKAKPASSDAAEKAKDAVQDKAFAELAKKLGAIVGASFGADDLRQVAGWMGDWGATPDAILCAYELAAAKGVTRANYVGKIVREWADKGVKTREDAETYMAETDARRAFYKDMMETCGLAYKSVTEAEKRMFDRWLDVYGKSPDELLELAKTKTAGIGNPLQYLNAILEKEYEKKNGKGKGDGKGGSAAGGSLSKRDEYYRSVRDKNLKLAEAHRKEVYAAAPELEKLDTELQALKMESISLVVSNVRDKKSAYERLEKEIAEKTAIRTKTMEKCGFAPDYTDLKYDCERCEDSGTVIGSGASCPCYTQKL